jgi:signal transduction histidine kinase
MSDADAQIRSVVAELRTIAERLRSPELPDEEAERLAREAADLVARAGRELDRALGERAGEPPE